MELSLKGGCSGRTRLFFSERQSGRTAGWNFPWAPQGQRPLRWKWGVLAGTVSLNLLHTQLLIFLTQNIHASYPLPESQPGTTPGLVGWGAVGPARGDVVSRTRGEARLLTGV